SEPSRSMYHRVMRNRQGSSKATRHLESEVGSILVFGLGIFSLASVWTYHPTDPSFFSNSTRAALNACGKVGAYLASGLLECFGLGSFLFPAALFFVAASVYKREGTGRLLGTLGGMTISVMALTVFLALQ